MHFDSAACSAQHACIIACYFPTQLGKLGVLQPCGFRQCMYMQALPGQQALAFSRAAWPSAAAAAGLLQPVMQVVFDYAVHLLRGSQTRLSECQS
jgi:hypothetical protein